MKFIVSTLTIAMTSCLVSSYSLAADTVDCYALPDTDSDIIGLYHDNDELTIACQTEGVSVNGSAIWDLTSDGCYVADLLVNTGSSDLIKDECETYDDYADNYNEDDSGLRLFTRADNYPYKGSCSGVDPWKFYKCQCTSFVAFRLNKVRKIKFHNHYKGTHWSNGNTWDEAARQTGVKINKTPKVGAVAQTNAGSAGHVAWVTAVSGSKVTVEEYNWNKKKEYGKRTVPKTTFNYIHL